MFSKQSSRLSEKKGLRLFLFLLFPVSQLLLLTGIFLCGTDPVRPIHIILPVLLCILSDAVLAAALRYTGKRASLLAENRIMEQKIEDQSRYYAALADHYQAVRRVRHDIDNHLYTTRILVEDGKTEEAILYADSLMESISKVLQKEGFTT